MEISAFVSSRNPIHLKFVRDVADPQSGIDIGFIAQEIEDPEKRARTGPLARLKLQPLFIFANADLGRPQARSMIYAAARLSCRRLTVQPVTPQIRVLRLYDITPDNTSLNFMPLVLMQ